MYFILHIWLWKSLMSFDNLVLKYLSQLITSLIIWKTKGISLKPSISTHSKPCTMPRMRLLKCFVLQHSMIKTKHLRKLVQRLVRGFEWVEILGFRAWPWSTYHLQQISTLQVQLNINDYFFLICFTVDIWGHPVYKVFPLRLWGQIYLQRAK